MRLSFSLFAASLLLLPVLASAQSSAPQTNSQSKTTPVRRPLKPTVPALPPVPLPAEPGKYAVFYTSMGNIVCRLFDSDAPKTVANFVGLASGTKPWTDPATGKLKRTPLYSGTIFHRVIPGFMIQGGDPLGNGTGSPGYKFEDEFNSAHVFDKPGILAMANSGPNTNGSQFFITVAPTEHLNGKHTIFGEVVSGQEVADQISKTPTNPDDDKPLTPVKLTRIVIRTVRPAAPPAPGTPAKKP
jgi:peptidyl-prolyl cis-trans isomerase A (cyclophilin A)